MKKMVLLVFISLALPMIFLISGYSQEDMRYISAEPFVKPRRPPAIFDHDAHNEKAGLEECYVCHHLYDENGKLLEDESSEDQACSDCHELARSGNKPALMKAFHDNCKGCHKERKKGPLMCGQCHVRALQTES